MINGLICIRYQMFNAAAPSYSYSPCSQDPVLQVEQTWMMLSVRMMEVKCLVFL